MSGDVQPRKRKDKKKKKDEQPTPEELRGTAATFGEGDVLIHSQHEEGTGGHWCAKIIFFSLLAVLVALVGLIILENRGLSELEANSVESRYTGVLDGWTEDVADDHHDEHTLELNHPSEEEHDESEAEDGDSAEDVLLEDIEREVEDSTAEPYRRPADDHQDDPEHDDEDDLAEQSEEEEDADDQSEGDTDDDDDGYLEQDNDDDDEDQGQVSPAHYEMPYEEVEESSEQLPADTLLEEEEYEREQEQQRRLEEEEGHEDGANMIPEEEWGEEPDEERWRRELDLAEDEMSRGAWEAAVARAGAAALQKSARALWVTATCLDRLAEQRRDNSLLERAIDGYLRLIENHRLTDERLTAVAERVIDRARFRGTPLAALPAHRALCRRFPGNVTHHNQLVVSALTANKIELAHDELRSILARWPDDGSALAHYGFVLKMQGRAEEAVRWLRRALVNSSGHPHDARFHYHLGDALLALGRKEEADAVHERAAELGYFKSAAQRSLYNVDRLTARPWWDVRQTPYRALAERLEARWRDVLAEGRAAAALYEKEREGLQTRGSWTQLELMSRGREVAGRCALAPVTCDAVRAAGGAACRRGQVKFSLLAPGSHVRAHAGPTNTRLRLHLALANTEGASLRVHNETRQWETGRVLLFDDSFEHEAWHAGPAPRLVLIVDVWHPELTARERASLSAL